MKKELERKERVLIGFTLFSMFFGAGNLIFPPLVGIQAGTSAVPAMAGLLISAVGLPILGVAAVAKCGGLDRLAGRVHPAFASVFTLLIYVMIGPGLAIPRTASTSFEMAAAPFLGAVGTVSRPLVMAIYSLLFFTLAFLFALRPDRLKDMLGKIMTPALLALIAVIFAGCLFGDQTAAAAPTAGYERLAAVKGFVEGYQTMDTIAALNFGIVIAMNIQGMGVKRDGDVARETIKAGGIAGVLLAAVYSCLAYVGVAASGLGQPVTNGADVLTLVVHRLFGTAGTVIIALIFFIACLNVCTGLLSCCSEYFCQAFPRLGYRGWLGLFAAVSLVVSNAGLDAIIRVSAPALSMIYPVAIALIVLAFLPGKLKENRLLYRITVTVVAVWSVGSGVLGMMGG